MDNVSKNALKIAKNAMKMNVNCVKMILYFYKIKIALDHAHKISMKIKKLVFLVKRIANNVTLNYAINVN